VLALAVWPWRETVRAAGVIRPAGENTIVQSRLDGTLASVWVKENQSVRKGERLAVLDRRSLEDEKRKLEAELQKSLAQEIDSGSETTALQQQQIAIQSLNASQLHSSESEIAKAEATLRFRQSELQRYRTLLSSGAVAITVVDEKQAQADLARNDLAKAHQALSEQRARGAAELARLRQGGSQTLSQRRELGKLLDQTRSRLAEVRRALENSDIQAPTAGIVISSNLRHPQQVIRAGDVLAQIAPLSGALIIKVQVPSRDVGTIRAKQSAYLRVSGCPYPEFGVMKAQVLNISADTIDSDANQASPANFQVSLQPSASQFKAGHRQCQLRHGMDVQADIVTRQTTVLGFLLTKIRLNTGA
jgi:multidrug efflux pump subunit AcrA (membrane-fusion protein)